MLGDKLLITQRFFQRIEIGPLNVFNDCDFERGPVIDVAHDNRHFHQTGKLGSTPAAFTRDDLELAVWQRPRDDRLNYPVLTDRTCQILQFAFVEMTARVARVARDVLDRDHPVRTDIDRCIARRHRLIHLADQRCQTAPQAALRYIVVHTLYPIYYVYAATLRILSRWITSEASCRYAWLPAHFRS
ncbi:hypothetical protein D3C71_1653080 [compost metagenome]